jgi:hypothetical protein
MIEFLLKLARSHRWKLIGCSYDEIRIQFAGKPANPLHLATQLYSLRSDEKGIIINGVAQLANSKKDFAGKLTTQNPIVRLWWD